MGASTNQMDCRAEIAFRGKNIVLLCNHPPRYVVEFIDKWSNLMLNSHNVSMTVIFLLREASSKVIQNVIFHAAIARKGNFDVAG